MPRRVAEITQILKEMMMWNLIAVGGDLLHSLEVTKHAKGAKAPRSFHQSHSCTCTCLIFNPRSWPIALLLDNPRHTSQTKPEKMIVGCAEVAVSRPGVASVKEARFLLLQPALVDQSTLCFHKQFIAATKIGAAA